MIGAYGDALPESRARTFKEKTAGKLIKRQVDEFNRMLESHLMGLLLGDLKENLESSLSGTFAFIRTLRNEAGHPTGVTIDRVIAYANLTLFPGYVKKVYELKTWLDTNTPLS